MIGVLIVACLSLSLLPRLAAADPVEWPVNGHWYEAFQDWNWTWVEAAQAAQAFFAATEGRDEIS